MSVSDLEHQDMELSKLAKNIKILKIAIIPCIVIINVLSFLLSIYTKNSVFLVIAVFIDIILICIFNYVPKIYEKRRELLSSNLEQSILHLLGIKKWKHLDNQDDLVIVKSKQSFSNYSDIKYFKESSDNLQKAIKVINEKNDYSNLLKTFLEKNEYENISVYPLIKSKILLNLRNLKSYFIVVSYTSSAGKKHDERIINVTSQRINQLLDDKTILMSKTEYTRYLKDQEQDLLQSMQAEYYEKVNKIIDKANYKSNIVIINDLNELDNLIKSLFDRTVNCIKKIKSINSEEWTLIDKYIKHIDCSVDEIIQKNKTLLDYYNSESFATVKEACSILMNSQKEFNEYIDNKVKSLSGLFGMRVTRNATNNDDLYNYVHPYKKQINPFVAELSSTVFGSAENNPLEYVIKYFYNDKAKYPEQIQRLHLLIEELETLKDAKKIIDNLKNDLQKFIKEVPSFVMSNDESGFYSRLGLTIIDEGILNFEYKFSYTSDSGRVHRYFTIPMTEETIINLINALENRLSLQAFTREQRALMTTKLRLKIMKRDNYTCTYCGNSTYNEPNLLLEIDHIVPVSKGGTTEEGNLQTLCWKCNRQKGNKML